MRKALAIAAQFLLFLFADAVGSLFYQPFHIQTSLTATSLAPRSYVWDGVILMSLLYFTILVIAAIRKHLAASAPASTLALALAAVAGYLMKLGFITHNW